MIRRWPLILVNVAGMVLFTALFMQKNNFEFLYYNAAIVLSIVPVIVLVWSTESTGNYPSWLLWALTGWGVLHMAGGLVYVGGTRLYDIDIIPLLTGVGVFRFDRLVHAVGLFLLTICLHSMKLPWRRWAIEKNTGVAGTMLIFAVLQEGLEQVGSAILPQTGVGDYIDTTGDIIADVIGIAFALLCIRLIRKEKKN